MIYITVYCSTDVLAVINDINDNKQGTKNRKSSFFFLYKASTLWWYDTFMILFSACQGKDIIYIQGILIKFLVLIKSYDIHISFEKLKKVKKFPLCGLIFNRCKIIHQNCFLLSLTNYSKIPSVNIHWPSNSDFSITTAR